MTSSPEVFRSAGDGRRAVDVTPLMSGSFNLDGAEEEVALAADRKRAVKVEITFTDDR